MQTLSKKEDKPAESDKDKGEEKEEMEKTYGKLEGPCIVPNARAIEAAAYIKAGIGGTATAGAGDPSLNPNGGLPGAGPMGSDVEYKGDATEQENGDEANTFGPGKSIKKLSPPSKKVDEGYSADFLDLVTNGFYDKFYDNIKALEDELTKVEKDAKFSIRAEIQTASESNEPTGITYDKFVTAADKHKWGYDGYDASDEKERENPSSNGALKDFLKYDVNNDLCLTRRQALWLAVNRFALHSGKECDHCFKDTRKWIDYVWKVLNCNNKEALLSENLWNNIMQNEKFKEKILPRSANDFILAVDTNGDMSIGRDTFIKSIFRGLFERTVGPDGVKEKSEILGNRDLRCEQRKKMGLANECVNKGA